MPVTYTESEWRSIARRYLQELRSKTGWKITGIVRTKFPGSSLVALSPGWSLGTDVDDNTSTAMIDEVAQKALDTAYVVSEAFERKYPGIKFYYRFVTILKKDKETNPST